MQAVKDAKAAVDARERMMSDEIDRKMAAAREKLQSLQAAVKAAAAGTDPLDETVTTLVGEAAESMRELEALRLEPGSTLKAAGRVDKVVGKVDAAEQALADARTMKLRKRRASRTAHAAVSRSNLDVAEQKLSALIARNAKGGYPDDDEVAVDIEAAKHSVAEARSLQTVIDAAMPEPPLETTEKFVVKASRAMDAVQKAIKSFNAREQARRDAEKADLLGRLAAGAAVIAAAAAALKSAAAKLTSVPAAPRVSALLDDAGASLTVVDNKRLRALAAPDALEHARDFVAAVPDVQAKVKAACDAAEAEVARALKLEEDARTAARLSRDDSVVKARKDIGPLRETLNALQARNRQMGSPADEATALVEKAATAVVSGETFERLLTQSPQSESLATQFVGAVRAATRALEDALEAVNARERALVEEADGLLAEVQLALDEVVAANKRAGDPDDSASTVCVCVCLCVC